MARTRRSLVPVVVVAAIAIALGLGYWWGSGKRAPAGRGSEGGGGAAAVGSRGDVLVDSGGAEAIAAGPELRGRIDDAGGGPIPGATVRVKLAERSLTTTSDEDGVYVIRVPAATYVVEADADGYAPQEVQVEVVADAVQDFRLQPAGLVRGQVRRGGVAVEGATVALLSRDDVVAGDVAPRTATTSADGGFALDDVAPGGWIVLARHRGEVGVSPGFTVAPAQIVDGVIVELGAGATVSGTIVDEAGAPLAGAVVTGVGAGFARAVTTGTDGRFRLDEVAAGTWTLEATGVAGHAAARRVITVGSTALEGLVLVMPAAIRCSGVVRGPDGRAAAMAVVNAFVRASGDDTVGLGAHVASRADAAGGFTLALAPGELRVRAVAEDGRVAIHGPAPLRTGDSCQLELVLGRGPHISGRVTWDDGSVAAGVRVLGAGAMLGASVNETRSGADGRYTLAPFEPGVVWVWARSPGAIGGARRQRPDDHVTVQLAAGESRDGVELVLKRAAQSISGRVEGPDGAPLAGALVGAALERGSANPRLADRALSGREVTSDADGRFEITGLTDAAYTVWSTAPGLPEAQVPHVVASATGIVVRFQAAVSIAGVVVDEQGRPVSDYVIVALPAALPGEARERTVARWWGAPFAPHQLEVDDRRGRFRFPALPPDTYQLVVVDARARSGAVSPVVSGSRDVTITVGDSGRIRGRVIDHATAAPVAGLEVALQLARPVTTTTAADGSFELRCGITALDVGVWVAPPLDRYVPDGWVFGGRRGELALGDLALAPGNVHERKAVVGLEAESRDGVLRVVRVKPGSTAAGAGVVAGDVVKSVEGQDVARLGGAGLRYLLAGTAGTDVRVGLDGRTVTLRRE